MGWSDPEIIAQIEEASRHPQPRYETALASVLSGCDEMERSPFVEMQVCANVTRGLVAQVLAMERAEAKGELERSAKTFDGLLIGMSACLAMLFDTGDRATDKAITADFLQMLDDAIKERARSRRRAKNACQD